jgi:hypothetical protein
VIIRALAASLFALSLGPANPPAAVAASDAFERQGQQIFFAVLEGLYQDGVPNDLVDKIIAIDEQTKYPVNFVWACPVCMPAYEAFRLYRGRPQFNDKAHRDTFGPGLPKDQVERLTAVDQAVSQRAIEELIQGWMDRRMDELRLTPDERGEWRKEMEKRRKEGMSYLQNYKELGLGGSYAGMKTCPICEGANGACRAR